MTGLPDRRFGGLERLFGLAAADRIRNAHVAIVGIGGVGSWVAEALARSGVGRITLIDFDQVAESNINRQIQAVQASIGQAKVDAMRERILSYFPECQVTCV
ncbi:MAG: UBA/ThiF-type NAD/FAD binding protein, partial [uncultured bacterium]